MTESESPGPAAADLSAPARRHLAQLVAAVLPELSDLPPALRPVASFVPNRRARLGESAIVAALDRDPDLRRRLAAVSGLDRAEYADRPPAEVAALAWLARPEGWADLVAGAERVAARDEDDSEVERLAERVDRLERRLARSEEQRRTERDRHAAAEAAAKEEYATLRRRLGEARAAERRARAELEDGPYGENDRTAALEEQIAERDAELRLLRERVAELEEIAAGRRRTARAEREEPTVRARLLLDALIDASTGLRRELGLPAVEGAPADRVEAALDEATAAPGGPSVTTPARLEQLLKLPRARLVVDGYNVTKTHWETQPLDAQRSRLLHGLAAVVARTGAETTVVFDAADVRTRPSAPAPRSVKVRFSPYGVIADDVIRDLVDAEPPGRVVVVVTDDQEVAADVARSGARVAGTGLLVDILG